MSGLGPRPILPGSITGTHIAANAIGGNHIADSAAIGVNMASVAIGAVGCIGFFKMPEWAGTAYGAGANVPGSALLWASVGSESGFAWATQPPAGTWRVLGYNNNSGDDRFTVCQRVA